MQAILKWNDGNVNEQQEKIIRVIIDEIVQPYLIWKAGREAEAVRAMAIQALCSFGDACSTQVQSIFPQLVTHFQSLIDDNLAITRAYTIRCIMKSGPFAYEGYRQMMTGYLLLLILAIITIVIQVFVCVNCR